MLYFVFSELTQSVRNSYRVLFPEFSFFKTLFDLEKNAQFCENHFADLVLTLRISF